MPICAWLTQQQIGNHQSAIDNALFDLIEEFCCSRGIDALKNAVLF